MPRCSPPARRSPDGTLTYTPAANANGSATITLRITDNGGTANGGIGRRGQTDDVLVLPFRRGLASQS